MNPERLIFRRQYLLTPVPVHCPFMNNCFTLSPHAFLYTHTDLITTLESKDQRKIILLGDLYDYRNSALSNQEILHELIQYDHNQILVQASIYCGRYVIVLIDHDEIYLLTDAASSRKVYYYKHEEGLYCASQPHLLARILNLAVTSDPSRAAFYHSEKFRRLNNSNIGNTTCYDNVFQLIPNHYLRYYHSEVIRYWPNHKTETLPLNEVADRCAVMIKGYAESISNRYPVMLPVTAGKDSRLLLSASKNISEKFYYYILRINNLSDRSLDITIPGRLLPKLGLDFHIKNPCSYVASEFRKAYFNNNPMASMDFLPVIYRYYMDYSDRVNLPGTFVNLVEDLYETGNRPITGELLANLIHVDNFDYAVAYFTEWYSQCKDVCKKYEVNVFSLLYWEERIANWGTQIQLDKDIAQEEVIPYNSRLLIETMLMSEKQEREKPDYRLFSEITLRLWPETLQEPCNPNLKQKVLMVSKYLGIIKPVKEVYYRFVYRFIHFLRAVRKP